MAEAKDKGRSDRTVISALTAAHMTQHIYSAAPNLYQSIRTDLGLDYTQIGIMAATSNLVGGLMQMAYSLAGRNVTRRWLLTFANFAVAIGSVFTGVATRFETVILGSASAGVGTAGIHPISSSIIAQKWQNRKVALALSIFNGLGFVGNIIGPIILGLIALEWGWRFSYYVLAAILSVCAVVVFLELRGEPAADKMLASKSNHRFLDDLKTALRNKGAMLIILAQVFISGGSGMGVMTTWVPVWLRAVPGIGLNLDVWTTSIVSSIATSGGVIGTIVMARIAEKSGYLRTGLVSLSITTLMIFLLIFENSFNLLVIPHLFFLSMTTFSMGTLLQAQITNVCTLQQRDIIIGLFFTVGSGVGAAWQTILGSLADNYSFSAIWTIMVCTGIAAIICLFIAYRDLKTGQQLNRLAV